MAPVGVSVPSVVGATAVPPVTGTNPTGGTNVSKTGFFQEGGGASIALGAIQVLGSLWSSFQQNKLAKENLRFQKEAYYTNLENQEQSYNTELEDRINARYATEGRENASAQAADYVARNKL
jgi:hypothetical protein